MGQSVNLVKQEGNASLKTLKIPLASTSETKVVVVDNSGNFSYNPSISGGGGSGTVTTLSIISANGFAGTVANPTTTPAITLTTSITGLLKGNGTSISAATAGVDYVIPSGTVVSASYALTASYTPGSGTATSASYASTSSLPLLGVVTASALNTTITFTRGNGTTFDITVAQSGSVSSASYANYASNAGSASYALTASYALNSNGTINTGSLVTTGSFNAYTASINAFSASINSYTASNNATITNFQSVTASLNAATASLNLFTASLNSYTASNNANITSLYAFSSSINTATASFSLKVGGLEAATASLNAFSSSHNLFTASIFSYTASNNANITSLNTYTSSINAKTGSFATTGSNTFTADQIIQGNLTVTRIVVQTITASQEYSSGSNVFGNSPSNTQVFTGSMYVAGAISGSSFSGAGTNLIGTATSLNIGGNAATVTTNANLTGMVTSVGNATTVVTNANLTGNVTSVGNATTIASGVVTSDMIADGTIVNGDINASAAIVDTKLATISTGGKVSNSATTATNANTANAIVARDASGNFSAGTITAALTGNASTATTATNWSGYNAGLLNWTTGDGTSTSGQNRMAARLYSLGRKIYLDETFNYGVNSLNVYDNNSTGTVLITRVAAPYGVSTSGYQAQIQHTGASQTPGYGGFYFATQTRSNATFACVFRAKLPSGYTINWASNSIGTGGTSYWVTDNIGTGKYEDYVYVVRCGDSGTFSSTMFFYILGSPAPSSGSPLTWYLSSATVYDVDDRDNTNTQGYIPLTSNNYTSYAQAALSGTGFVKISGTTISYDTSTYLTGNQTITLSGDISGTGTTAISTTIGAAKVTNAMLAGSIADSNLLTISTGGKVSNSATTATSANTVSAIVARDASGNFSAGTITANLTGTASIATNSTQLNGISSTQIFNNMGDSHGTRTSFDASSPSYNFGFRYVQGNGNGPETGGGSQFYSWYIGLGNDYPATGAGSYGMYVAVPRGATTPYMSVRYNENNGLGSWIKIAAGYADSAGTVTTNANLTGMVTSVGNATTVVTNANLTGVVTSVGNATSIANGAITNAMLANSAVANLTGTNSGDQTNISGNAATATTSTNLYGAGASYIASSTGGKSYSNVIQVREAGLGGAQGSDMTYAPRLGFHWSGVVASSIAIEASGRIGIFNNPGTSYENFIANTIYANSSFQGNLTGNVTGNATTATSVSATIAVDTDANLVYANVATDDYVRIRAGGAYNAGYLEIATADDGTEPIYVRQYTGVFSSLTRTATLLDGSGNTSFPNNVQLGASQNRPVQYDSNGGNFRITPNNGGWATGYFFNNYSGAFKGGFGGFGSGDTFNYYWIGGDYNAATMYITSGSSGRVGVNTASPSYPLDVSGDIRGTGNLFISTGNATGGGIILADDGDIVDLNDGYCAMRFSSGVRIHAGNRTGAAVIKLGNGGDIVASADITAYGSPSDINLKENIKPLEGALEKVMKLQGVSFTWKEDTEMSKMINLKDDIGFIAQAVQEVIPNLVRKNDNGLLSLRDKGITALLVEAIKEQQQQIDELKSLLQNK
jgi:hypothetical protein